MEKEEILKQELCKRVDKLENYIYSREYIKKIVNSISEIQLCEQCKVVVMVKIAGIQWFRDGVFQIGNIKGRPANWCSNICEEKHKKH